MKPYVYSEYLKQTKELYWFQGGDNVTYRRRKLGYDFLDEEYEPEQITCFCLSFNYSFEVDWEEVQFAYCPPFTYSETMEMVGRLKRDSCKLLQDDQESIF
jgi:hypothetical protein